MIICGMISPVRIVLTLVVDVATHQRIKIQIGYSENKGLRSLYVILSAAIIILSGILLFFLCRQVKKRLTKIAEIEANLDDYSDIDNINIHG